MNHVLLYFEKLDVIFVRNKKRNYETKLELNLCVFSDVNIYLFLQH